MRPRLVEFLDGSFGTALFGWIVPDPSVVYAIAILAVLFVYVRSCAQAGLSRYHALGSAIWGIAGGLVGARLFYLLQHFDAWTRDWSMALDLSGSTASWGAYLGGGLGFATYLARWGSAAPGWRHADAAASCLALGPAIGRWACFLNGDDFGTLSDLPWAVRYPHGSYPFAHQVREGVLDPLAELSLPGHPLQLYLSFNAIVLFVVFRALWKRRGLAPGALFALYWTAYLASRFFWEFFRAGVERPLFGVLSTNQLMALGLCALALVALTILSRSPVAGRPTSRPVR